jgi:hypothetical protein
VHVGRHDAVVQPGLVFEGTIGRSKEAYCLMNIRRVSALAEEVLQ